MPSAEQPMIEVRELTRVFRTYRKIPGLLGSLRGLIHREFTETVAADAVSFSVSEGEFVGFLGPNGAGKTTVLKMLSGLIHPTSGQARVAGFDPVRRENAYRRLFALVMGQKNQLWWDLPARESFNLLRHIYGLDAGGYRATLDELSELLGVGGKFDVMVRELSLGERMKMELIAALLHRPRVLFLDEPTIGLDIVSQRAVRRFLRDYNRRHRVTILLTSHYLDDIQELCERVIVINHGRKIHDGALDRLNPGGVRLKVIRFRMADGGVPPGLAEPGLPEPQAGADGSVVLRVPVERTGDISRRILAAGTVSDITIEDVPIEDVIADLFGREAGAPPAGDAARRAV